MGALNQQKIVFFDGVCNLCNGVVDFLIRHNRDQSLMFASLQGRSAREILGHVKLDTIVYYRKSQLLTKSDAALALCMELSLPWRALLIFKVVPKVVRDKIYDFIAEHRYQLFGIKETCRLPSAQEKSRFLD